MVRVLRDHGGRWKPFGEDRKDSSGWKLESMLGLKEISYDSSVVKSGLD